MNGLERSFASAKKNGNVSLWDPGAWFRTMNIHYRKANEETEENHDND